MKVEQVTVVTANQVESDAVMWNNEVFFFHDTGLTRRVFANKDKTKVVKVPVTEHDYDYNRREAEMWANATGKVLEEFVPCKLLPNGWLEMDFVHTLKDPETQDKWGHLELTAEDIQFAASCRNEVGFDKEGKLKCYDFDEYRKY